MTKHSSENVDVIKDSPDVYSTLAEDNSLREFRQHNLMLMGLVFGVFLLPFSINAYFKELYIIGVATSFLVIISLINAYFIKYKKKIIIPGWLYFNIFLFILFYANFFFGDIVLYWTYPVFIAVYFVSELKIARIILAIVYLLFVSAAFYLYEFNTSVRFAVTLLMLTYFSDVLICELIKLQQRLLELAIRDPLTNVYNRRHMNTCIDLMIEETNRGFGSCSLLLLDIDFFKNINDKFGHDDGDQILCQFSDTLRKRQRKVDFIFRAGGEEFIVLLRNTDLNNALTIAENLRVQIEETNFINGHKITISIGVAEYQPDEKYNQWLKRADENLYEAKRAGRNCVYPQLQ